MFDKVFLHVGLGKTGTSYLQNCLDVLSRNNELACTSYPVLNGNLDFVKIQSGNGEAIAFQLLKKKVPEFHEATVAALVKTFVETADKTKPSLLMSSEHFCSADPDRFRFLTQLLLTYARKVEIIIFVRPLDELCHSRYHQQVKRHSHSLAYDDLYFSSFSEKLVRQIVVFGSLTEHVHVFNYKRVGLLAELLCFLNEDAALENQFNNKIVNRSLTDREMSLLRVVNGVFKNDALSTSISDRWIYAQPEAISAKESADDARLVDIFRGAISANYEELKSEASRSMLMGILPAEAPACVTGAAPDRAFNDGRDAGADGVDAGLLLIALEEINKLLGFERVLLEYADKYKPTRDIFDPLHYLLLNRDVLNAGVDPIEHFKMFGFEEGRFAGYSCVASNFGRPSLE